MRQLPLLAAIISLLCGWGLAAAAPNLKLDVTVGFDGNYRANTLVPVIVEVENTGDTVRGEFRLAARKGDELDRSVLPAVINAGAKKRFFLSCIPRRISSDLTVEFWSRGQVVKSATFKRCQDINPTDRLLVIVGGAGASLSYLNGQPIVAREYPVPRPWNLAEFPLWEQMRGRGPGVIMRSVPPPPVGPGMPPGGPGMAPPRGTAPPSPTGSLKLAYMSSDLLPENPEAYGSVAMLALMSSVTENSISADAQRAIAVWTTAGGHLLVAQGGVPARLQAPFFAGLLPQVSGRKPARAETITNADGGTAVTVPLGSGLSTLLSFDPDAVTATDWRLIGQFYARLIAKDPRTPASYALRDAWSQAVMVRNLRPPDLRVIVTFLLLYLIILVPVNYFVLKRLDKREFAWVTTPAIVLIFTMGAYGIGYMTKGHRLIVNVATVVETSAGQRQAEAVSGLLIFSPARTSYTVDLGASGLLAREVGTREEQRYYGGGYYEMPSGPPLTFFLDDGKLALRNVRVDMWDFRQFTLAHALDLGKGFTANLKSNAPGAVPRATGTVTNNTPYDFILCELYADGAQVQTFALRAGQTVTVEETAPPINMGLDDSEQFMQSTMQSAVRSHLTPNELGKGLVMIGYTDQARVPVKVDQHNPTTAITMVVVHF
ncbi:MAG: hypothetical protein ACYC7E_05755 [Armatimonadota bacterium]